MAARRYYVSATAITMLMLMLMMSVSNGVTTQELNTNEPMETEGRQDGLSDVDCSGYTFEDLFDYNFAAFNIDIGADWGNGRNERYCVRQRQQFSNRQRESRRPVRGSARWCEWLD